MTSHLSLSGLCAIITRQLNVPALRDVWVVAELSDVRQSGGHCYMELIEKNADTGQTVARLRGIIGPALLLGCTPISSPPPDSGFQPA